MKRLKGGVSVNVVVLDKALQFGIMCLMVFCCCRQDISTRVVGENQMHGARDIKGYIIWSLYAFKLLVEFCRHWTLCLLHRLLVDFGRGRSLLRNWLFKVCWFFTINISLFVTIFFHGNFPIKPVVSWIKSHKAMFCLSWPLVAYCQSHKAIMACMQFMKPVFLAYEKL
jgi:hypothetical protein